jgi:hypothetical protein
LFLVIFTFPVLANSDRVAQQLTVTIASSRVQKIQGEKFSQKFYFLLLLKKKIGRTIKLGTVANRKQKIVFV